MYTFPSSPAKFHNLPEDVLLEVCQFLEAEDIFSLRQTCKRVHDFTACRHLWHQLSLNLCYRMPLALPPLRSRSSITGSEYQTLIKRGLRLEYNWRSEHPKPSRQPRYLTLIPHKSDANSNSVMMLRLLPGGKLFLLITTDGQLTCRDILDGRKVGEWKHGGVKVHSIDVDVVDDGQAMILTVSVDRPIKDHESLQEFHHMVHVLRVDVTETPEAGLSANFVHIMASPWDTAWWIVSVEGDIIAAYSCDLDTKPLAQFVVWIANWRTATAAVVHLPESIIHLETWPTLQVVGGQVIIHEERGCSPASIIFPVPDTLFSTESADPLPHVKITPTLILDGDHEDNAYQTRFSKLWRNAPPKSAKSRPLSLFSISTSVDPHAKHTISVQTFDPFPTPAYKQHARASESTRNTVTSCESRKSSSSQSPTSKPTIPRSKVWRRTALVPESQEGLRFTFCLGRYGSFPIWVEEDDPPEDLPDGTLYMPELRLMGLFTDYKETGKCYVKELEVPEGVKLDDLQCLDFDDAEGVLCGVTEKGVWIIEYA